VPIRDDVKLGKNVCIPHPNLVNLYGCDIGDNCRIGAHVTIGEAKVGKGCKILDGAYIPKGVTIEDNVFISSGVKFTNNPKPQLPNTGFEVVPTLVKEGAMIGVNACILCGVTIGRRAIVGMGAVVLKDVRDRDTVIGNPAIPMTVHTIRSTNEKLGL